MTTNSKNEVILIDGSFDAVRDIRVAILKDKRLFDLDIQHAGREPIINNVYKAVITGYTESLGAVFVNYGGNRSGFLPVKEIADIYLPRKGNTDLNEALHEGKELIVQVVREERGTKGAALTTYLSLASSYVVLMPNNPSAGGISKRISGEERSDLKDLIQSLNIPNDMGIIVRTAGEGRKIEDLNRDLQLLLERYQHIQDTAKQQKGPCLLYRESDIIARTVRDYLRPNVSQILVEDSHVHRRIQEHIQKVRPDSQVQVELYRDRRIPLFSRFQVESQIETAFGREVRLPSGGSLVIDYSEALISIDVNSARSTSGANIEETALNTNLEAANEVARQLRLRDIGGLIVIDFIDMSSLENQEKVERCLRDALLSDRARTQVGDISRFGLLEMSRQRLRPQLSEGIQIPCPRCHGHGNIRGLEALALTIIRQIEEAAFKAGTVQVQAQVPVDLATFLLNEKRHTLVDIEQRQQINVQIIPNRHLQSPDYSIKRFEPNDLPSEYRDQLSLQCLEKCEEPDYTPGYTKPISSNATPDQVSEQSIFHRFVRLFRQLTTPTEEVSVETPKEEPKKIKSEEGPQKRRPRNHNNGTNKTAGNGQTRRRPRDTASGEKSQSNGEGGNIRRHTNPKKHRTNASASGDNFGNTAPPAPAVVPEEPNGNLITRTEPTAEKSPYRRPASPKNELISNGGNRRRTTKTNRRGKMGSAIDS